MKNNDKNSSVKKKKSALATFGGWFRRMFMGASKDLAAEELQKNRSEKENEASAKEGDIEIIVSPGKQIVKNFCERKLALGALLIIIAMFLFVFIAPIFMPKYSDSYTEVTQKSIAPSMYMLSIPSELKNDIKMISSYASFTVGLSNAGKVYVWGTKQIGTTGVDITKIPEEVKNAKIEYVAAGIDHIVAIGDDGRVYAWGYSKLGQYGRPQTDDEKNNPNIAWFPKILIDADGVMRVDVENVKKLVCGYQCSAILMNDGRLYLWGNKHAYSNIDGFIPMVDNEEEIQESDYQKNFRDIDFMLNNIIAIDNNGYPDTGPKKLLDKVRPNINEPTQKLSTYLSNRKIMSLTVTANTVCYQLDDNSICFAGDFPINILNNPVLAEGEYYVSIGSGIHHYTGVTNLGNVYSWGGNTLDQCEVPKNTGDTDKVFAGGFQSYTVNSETNKLTAKWGLRGYIFGTDTYGADIMQRIINGGRMTMTIGAVAVVISSIIGIIIGCISGYFGGKVDIFLMRVTEIFAAIPFLPFALILSSIMTQMTISENGRIFIIMAILGVLSWTGLARLVRGQMLAARENEYVTAAKAMGVKESKIAFKHILPNVISVILVTLTLDFAGCMLTESSLSYLGFGVMYPRPTWGNMLNGANNATIISNYWWQWLFPALFLAITTICINIVGDALRDVMDPKSSSER